MIVTHNLYITSIRLSRKKSVEEELLWPGFLKDNQERKMLDWLVDIHGLAISRSFSFREDSHTLTHSGPIFIDCHFYLSYSFSLT